MSIAQQRDRAEKIASNIKLIQLQALIMNWQVIYGSIERENDATYMEDRSIVNKAVPKQYSQWQIRFVLDNMKLYMNKITTNEIKHALESQFQVFINVAEEGNPTMRMYLSESLTF